MKQAKPKLGLLTITEASKAFSKDLKTIRKRIGDLEPVLREGNSVYYDHAELAYAILAKRTDEEKSSLNLTEEKAKYYKAMREKLDVERKKLSGELVNMDEYDAEQEQILIEMREGLLQMSKRLARPLSKLNDPDKIAKVIEEEIKIIMEDTCQRAIHEETTATEPK